MHGLKTATGDPGMSHLSGVGNPGFRLGAFFYCLESAKPFHGFKSTQFGHGDSRMPFALVGSTRVDPPTIETMRVRTIGAPVLFRLV